MSHRHDDTRHVSKLSLSQTLSRWKNRSRESLNFEEPPITPDTSDRERNLGRRKSSISSFTSFMSSNSSNSERSLKNMGRAKTLNDEVVRPKSRSKEQPQKIPDGITRRTFSGNASYSSLIDISEVKEVKKDTPKKGTTPLPAKSTSTKTSQRSPSPLSKGSSPTKPSSLSSTPPRTIPNIASSQALPTNKAEITAANPASTPSPLSKPPPFKRLSLAVVSSSPNFSQARTTRPASMSLSPILPERSAKRASVLQVAPFFQRPTAIKEPSEEEEYSYSSASSGSDDLFSDTEDPYVDPTINLDEYDEDEAVIFTKTPVKHKVVCITCGHKFDTIDECFSHREMHQLQQQQQNGSTRRPLTQGATKMKRPASIAVDVQKERAALVQTKAKRFTSSRHSWSVREVREVGRV